MFLFDEKNQLLSIEDAKAQLKASDAIATPTLNDVQSALGNYYQQALKLQGSRLNANLSLAAPDPAAAPTSFLPGIGGNILAEIKKIICGILDGNSTEDQILQAVLNALATIIPGGVFIKALANIVVKYLLSTGIDAFCGVVPAPAPSNN